MLHDLRFPASKGCKIICTIVSFFILLDLINRILYDNLQSLSDFLTGLITVQNIRVQEFTSQMQLIFTAYPGTHSARYQLLSSGNCCTREERTWTLGGALPCPPLLPPEQEPTEAVSPNPTPHPRGRMQIERRGEKAHVLAETLPPHRPYDCPIDMVTGKEVSFGHIYALSLSELAEKLKDSLACGFVHPPASLAGAPMLFLSRRTMWSLSLCRLLVCSIRLN